MGLLTGTRYENLTVVTVWKRCLHCKKIWQGNYFEEWIGSDEGGSEKQSALPATCDACIDRWEIERRRRDLEVEINKVEEHMREAKSTKAERYGFKRKLRLLKKLQATYSQNADKWLKLNSRIGAIAERLQRLEA